MVNIELLRKDGRCKEIAAGKQVQCIDDISGRMMFILLSGRIEVFKPKGIEYVPGGWVSPGEAFGGYDFFFPGNESAFVAQEDSIVYEISESSFAEVAQSQPEVLLEILKAAYAPPPRPSKEKPPAKTENRSNEKTNENIIEKPKLEEIETVQQKKQTVQQQQSPPPAHISEGGIFPEEHKGYPGIIKPEYAKFVFKKDFKCTFCAKTFDEYKVFQSKLFQSDPTRYDLRKFYSGFQTEWYDIITCPHCYFSTFYNYYTEPRAFEKSKIEKELLAARAALWLDFDAERDIDYVFTTHYLALICSPGYLLNRRQIDARVWGNISWLYEDVEDDEMACFAAAKAADAYETLYTEGRLNSVQEQSIALTIAGMMYRAGKRENLKKYLFIAKTQKVGNKIFSELAEDLMDLLRAQEQKS